MCCTVGKVYIAQPSLLLKLHKYLKLNICFLLE
jgi:hypothetical protein